MAQYYYYMSSLPSLSATMGDLPSLEGLWASSESVVSEKDRTALRAILDNVPAHEEGVAKKWQVFERELRHAIARHRAQELGRSGREVHASGMHLEVWQILQGLLARTNPLDREQFLIDQMFAILEGWSSSVGSFSTEALMVYFLQLQLLSRRASFSVDLGQANFDDIYNKLKDKILNNDRGIL